MKSESSNNSIINNEKFEPKKRNESVRKHLLYKPSPSNFLVFSSHCLKELKTNYSLLFYFSSFTSSSFIDPNFQHSPFPFISKSSEEKDESESEEVEEIEEEKIEVDEEEETGLGCGNEKKENNIFSSDLVPFTRKPLILILEIDSGFHMKVNFSFFFFFFFYNFLGIEKKIRKWIDHDSLSQKSDCEKRKRKINELFSF